MALGATGEAGISMAAGSAMRSYGGDPITAWGLNIDAALGAVFGAIGGRLAGGPSSRAAERGGVALSHRSPRAPKSHVYCQFFLDILGPSIFAPAVRATSRQTWAVKFPRQIGRFGERKKEASLSQNGIVEVMPLREVAGLNMTSITSNP